MNRKAIRKALVILSAFIVIIFMTMLMLQHNADSTPADKETNTVQSVCPNGNECSESDNNYLKNDDVSTILDEIYDNKITANYRDIRMLPKNYTMEQAQKDHCYISTFYEVSTDQSLYDTFMKHYEKQEAAFLRIIQYTVEGDPIIVDVFYNSADHKVSVITDDTRDHYASYEDQGITLRRYDKLRIWEDEGLRYWVATNSDFNKFPEEDIDVDYFILDQLR